MICVRILSQASVPCAPSSPCTSSLTPFPPSFKPQEVPTHIRRASIRQLEQAATHGLGGGLAGLPGLKVEELKGNGALRGHSFLSQTARRWNWRLAFAWAFNLAALGFGCLFLLYSILVIFKDPMRDAEKRGRFIGACIYTW